MSRRSMARKRADAEWVAGPPVKLPKVGLSVPLPPSRPALDAFMEEAARRLLFQWWAHPVEITLDGIVCVGFARGRYESVRYYVWYTGTEIARAPNHVFERLQDAERQMAEAVEYQQLVYDAMQEMRVLPPDDLVRMREHSRRIQAGTVPA